MQLLERCYTCRRGHSLLGPSLLNSLAIAVRIQVTPSMSTLIYLVTTPSATVQAAQSDGLHQSTLTLRPLT